MAMTMKKNTAQNNEDSQGNLVKILVILCFKISQNSHQNIYTALNKIPVKIHVAREKINLR